MSELRDSGHWIMVIIMDRTQHAFIIAISEQVPSIVFSVMTVILLNMNCKAGVAMCSDLMKHSLAPSR